MGMENEKIQVILIKKKNNLENVKYKGKWM